MNVYLRLVRGVLSSKKLTRTFGNSNPNNLSGNLRFFEIYSQHILKGIFG